MPRYRVHRTFADGLHVPIDPAGAASCDQVGHRNMEQHVTWVKSYASTDKHTSFCIYDGPSPEAVRRAGQRNGLPVDRITELRVLDPFFYYS